MKIKKLSYYLPFIKIDNGLSSHQWHHKFKLSLLFIFPLLISISGGLFQIDKLTTRASQLANLERLTSLTIKVSHLLHILQKERGYAGIYIATNGTKFKAELLEQRELAIISNRHIYNLLRSKSITVNRKFEQRLHNFNQYLAEFKQVRLQVDHLTIDEAKAIQLYSQLNNKLLDVVATIVQLTVDSELTQAFSAYTLFLKGKERVGIERARFSIIFARGYFLANEYKELVKLEIEQTLFFHEFEELTSAGLYKSFGELFNDQVFTSVQQIKTNALVNNKVNITVTDWFNIITNKIDKLDLFADKISEELISNAIRLKQSSKQEMLYWLTSLIHLYIITTVAGIWLITHINRTAINRIKEYQSLFSNNSAAMVVIHAKSQNILYANQSFSKLLGYSQQQLSKLNVTDFHRKKDIAHILKLFEGMVSGEISVAEKVLFIRNDDKVFFADIFVFPIIIDKQEYLAAHVVDITSKLQAKQYIEQSELTLQMILDSINSAVVVVEVKNQQPVYMNKKAIEIYQNREEDESVWSLLEQGFFSNLNDDFVNNSIIKKQYFNKLKQRWYQISSNIIDWSDGRTVCLKMLKDITESYEAERRNKNLLTENRQLLCRNYRLIEQERKHIAKELHDELGQLLTGIKLQADFIARQTGKEHEALQSSAQSIVQATSELIKSTRDITNNLRPIILDQLGIIDAIKELVQNWRNLNKNIQFELNTESLPYQLSDELQISVYRIVQEGITNACKHADAHHIEIILKFLPLSHDHKRFLLQLKIQDDGKGFAQHSEYSNGMGIINMRERTEALNGVFCLINKANKGVEIFITIPLEPILQEELCH
ncbi:MAG: nitrate- and nitrite sensing domain-containing protein [Colwellia sp.]|nr:nitrate- and nitrite sensing domain-containing protein [Colwellia sp.]